MSEGIKPGTGIFYMKVGTHANETLSEIVSRKKREIEDTGYAMWGYGGNTCHPTAIVHPFAQQIVAGGNPLFICMEEMESRYFGEPLEAAEYSADGKAWSPIPPPIAVRGSRYALVITNLREVEFDLSMEQTRVAAGASAGRLGSNYVQGAVDKACLVVTDPMQSQGRLKPIRLMADIISPFAVFLRSFRELQ